MNEEKQRIAIAEACGWSQIYQSVSHLMGLVPGHGTLYRPIPDYLNDLDAMHHAENVLFIGRNLGEEYWCWVEAIVTSKPEDNWTPVHIGVLRATSAQRAEAFLRTIGKWEESE